MDVIDRKLPRGGICAMLVADETLRKGNIARINTYLVLNEKDLPKELRNAEYDYPIMVDLREAQGDFAKI